MKLTNYLLATVLTFSCIGSFAQKQTINTKKSTVKWLGEKIGGQHEGYINLKSGELEEKNNKIIAGTFAIDMTSITNTDLTDPDYNQKLVEHLKSDDFFGVKKFPTASLTITKATKFSNGKSSVTGNLTIKGKTEKITFEIVKNKKSYTTKMEIDRSKFDVKYGSTSFFDSLGDKAIYDIFILNIILITN
jgi:polyisoprenoid-binding protein YceI